MITYGVVVGGAVVPASGATGGGSAEAWAIGLVALTVIVAVGLGIAYLITRRK